MCKSVIIYDIVNILKDFINLNVKCGPGGTPQFIVTSIIKSEAEFNLNKARVLLKALQVPSSDLNS